MREAGKGWTAETRSRVEFGTSGEGNKQLHPVGVFFV